MHERNKHDIDLKKLDLAAAQGNGMAIQKQLDEMKNILRIAGNMFDYVTDRKTDAYAENLIKQRKGVYPLSLAMDRVINTCTKFPSYSDILSLVNQFTPKSEVLDRKTMSAEDKKLESIRDEFIKLLGEDKLEPYVKWWYKSVYDISKNEINALGFNHMIFERPALFDWKDAGTTNNFERIAQIGKKKIQEIRKNACKNNQALYNK